MLIVFACTKKEFIEYVDKKIISNKVYDAYKEIYKKKTKLNQIKAWARSLPFLKEVLIDLPDDVGIAIEFNIPLTSKMIDVVISGYDENKNKVVVLVELKGWEYVKEVLNQDGIVKTLIGKNEKNCLHPAYQILTYYELLKNYNINVELENIRVLPIVYLHNYDLGGNDVLYAKKYAPYYKRIEMFGKNDGIALKKWFNKNIMYGDNLEIIEKIETSEVRPTKKMLEVLNRIIDGKKEFTLLDEQKIIMEELVRLASDSFVDNKKRVVIINGGPGTGKSILALKSLGELLTRGLMGAYVSKNMAPRKVYKSMLSFNNEMYINELFKSSGNFFRDKKDKYDFLLVDEAHRLQEKSGLRSNLGENQIKEIINAARFSVFFIDEKQIITLKDIGKIASIKNYAKETKALVQEFELVSQFRCNGSDNYLDFLDSFLYNKRNKVKFNFDFKVVDSAKDLHELIKLKNTNNNARLVAGFCWSRNAKEADNQEYHDIVIEDFSLSWNLKHGEEFAVRENAINEVGCIYNVQGLEFDYIGVIIGPDLKYKDGLVITDYKERASTEKSLYGLYVQMRDNKEYYEKSADEIIRNTYRVLLTRGIKGCYVYCVDKNLQRHLKKICNYYLTHL